MEPKQYTYQRDPKLNLYVVGQPNKYGEPSSGEDGLLIIDEELAAIKAVRVLQDKEDRITELEQERDALRLALEKIANHSPGYTDRYGNRVFTTASAMSDIARAALRKAHEPVKEEARND